MMRWYHTTFDLSKNDQNVSNNDKLDTIYENNTNKLDQSTRQERYWHFKYFSDSKSVNIVAIREEYDSVEVDPITCSYGDQLASGYQMAFYCLDLIVNAQAVSLRVGSQTVLFVYQAEDSEFRQLNPVFEALAVSVLNHVNDPDQWTPSQSL